MFPSNFNQIHNGAIQTLVNVLATIDDLLNNIAKIYQDNKISTDNDINCILNNANRKANDWITKAVFDKEGADDEDDGENDDETLKEGYSKSTSANHEIARKGRSRYLYLLSTARTLKMKKSIL